MTGMDILTVPNFYGGNGPRMTISDRDLPIAILKSRPQPRSGARTDGDMGARARAHCTGQRTYVCRRADGSARSSERPEAQSRLVEVRHRARLAFGFWLCETRSGDPVLQGLFRVSNVRRAHPIVRSKQNGNGINKVSATAALQIIHRVRVRTGGFSDIF